MKELTIDIPRADIAGQLGFAAVADEPRWTDGTISIPAKGAPSRRGFDRRYVKALKEWFATARLKRTTVRVQDLVLKNRVANHNRYRMYVRMLEAGDEVPPIVVEELPGGKFLVHDGNHRTQAALDAGITKLKAYLLAARNP